MCARFFFTPRLACEGFSTRVMGGYRVFFFLIVLQGIGHASRKTDMRILVSSMGRVILSQVRTDVEQTNSAVDCSS